MNYGPVKWSTTILFLTIFSICLLWEIFPGTAFSETDDFIPVNDVVIPLFKAYYVPTPPMPVKTASVANPNIADVKIITPKDILIEARGEGITTIFLWFVEHDADWMVIGKPVCMKLNVKVTNEFVVETIKGTGLCPPCSLREWNYEKTRKEKYEEIPDNEWLINQDSGSVKIIE